MIETKDPSASDPQCIALYQQNHASDRRFLYIRDEATIHVARIAVRLYARALGAKRCAFVVDACFAEMFDSCRSDESGGTRRRHGHHQNPRTDAARALELRRRWSGTCTFATELLRGLCGTDEGDRPPTLSKSNLRVLSSLASSVLPVVVGAPLWTLPTSSREVPAREHQTAVREAKDGGLRNNSHNVMEAPNSTILQSNAALLCSFMEFLCQCTQALGGDSMQCHLPLVLFPLLERASPVGNHSSVQRAAYASLWKISATLGHRDISSLLASNLDYLVDAISLTLGRCAREQGFMDRSFVGVVNVVLQSAVKYGGIPAATSMVENGTASRPVFLDHMAMVGHMLKCLLTHFDQQSYMSNVSVFDTVSVFCSMVTFIEASVDTYITNNNSASTVMPKEEKGDDWYLMRLDFELNMESTGFAEDDDANEDAFEELERNAEVDSASGAPPFDGEDLTQEDENEGKAEGKDFFVQGTVAINSILSRCTYLLLCADLRIQVLCCETLLCGFRSLGKVGDFRKKLHGESASNPLLPAIADFWPSIVARLRSASTSLASLNRLSRSNLVSIRHAMATDQEKGTPSRTCLEVLLSELLQIVSEFCRSSDGFFADRFENDAYPVIAKLMHDFLPRDSNCLRSTVDRQLSPLFAEQKHSLLLSIIRCLECTFKSSCRYDLAGLIPSAGEMLFPFLVHGRYIGEATMAAVKAMLAVDSDALWRKLHTLSRRPFPSNPINKPVVDGITEVSKVTNSSHHAKTNECGHILSCKATELLDFIEDLPEQSL